jgi:hypothetical protein
MTLTFASQSAGQLEVLSVPLHTPSPHTEQSCGQLDAVSPDSHTLLPQCALGWQSAGQLEVVSLPSHRLSPHLTMRPASGWSGPGSLPGPGLGHAVSASVANIATVIRMLLFSGFKIPSMPDRADSRQT